MMALVKSSFFSVLFWIATIVHATLSSLTFPFHYKTRYWFITRWSHFIVWMAKHICGIDYRIEGLENLPDESLGAVVLCKHQSTWETLALQTFLPPLTFVLKKELLNVPFFGWALRLLEPIGIDRGAGRKALAQIIREGKQRLDQGRWILLFPEGTRIPPGETKRFGLGGAVLATSTEYPIVPIAHNAGVFWPKRTFLKKAGVITVRIGKPIDTKGKGAEEINEQVKQWIDSTVQELESTAS